MAINRATRYPGRFDAPDAGQPEGAFKNKTGPGAVDGSYLEKDWANDQAAFFSSLLQGEAADGNVDEVGASQYFNRLIDIIVPIGSAVFRSDNTDPSLVYPGTTWERAAEGRYIASVGQHTDSAGTTKTINAGNISEGTYLHQLIESEIPAHRHLVGNKLNAEENTGSPRKDYLETGTPNAAQSDYTGGDQPHNNMPPGFAMYVWVRLT